MLDVKIVRGFTKESDTVSLSRKKPESPRSKKLAPKQTDVESETPPWASSETPPQSSQPSLRDIQMQQVKKQQSLYHSPKTKTSGFTVTSDSPGTNRWFKPEIDATSSIRSLSRSKEKP
uniref:Uncharacterized protein n=1 Tax=Brassica oleracea var. oleracea TaxID=109376 RepID=A0A0D3AFS6_BRAOL